MCYSKFFITINEWIKVLRVDFQPRVLRGFAGKALVGIYIYIFFLGDLKHGIYNKPSNSI